jgi:Flp pilus assembly protein TadG
MSTPPRVHRHRSQENGAVAVIVAVSMTMLILAGAMVLDFGLVRLDRQLNKSAGDSAAMSALEAMRHVDALGNETGKAAPYPAVCSALEYLKANQPEFASVTGTLTDGTGASLAGAACPLSPTSPLLNVACDPDNRATWAWYSGTADGGRLRVDIKAGYVPSEDAAAFPEENLSTLVADQGAPQHKGCDQLAVLIAETRTLGLGKLATDEDMTSSVRSVARVDMGDDNSEVVALVTLERRDCQSLYTNGTTTKIMVDGYLGTPGMMHSDSLGAADGDDCSSKEVINVDGNNSGAIVAGASDDGKPGVIGIVALNGGAEAVADNATDPVPYVYTEPYPPGGGPQGHELVSRSPADNDYFTGVKAAISAANAAWATPSAANAVVPSTRCSANNLPDAAALSEPGTVYFNCPGGVDYGQDVTLAASRVIFAGDVKVRSGKSFVMPNARSVYIRGRAGFPGLDNQGFFRMHTQGGTTCADSSPSARGRLVVGVGEIKSKSGNPVFQVCNTAVIMLGGHSEGCVPSTAGTEPQDATSCTTGFLDLAGGASTDWTAPNLVGAGRTSADLDDLEDLALWTESEAGSSIRGSGSITLAGVFILPNANPFSVGGSGSQDVEDSQYFARKLGASGGGTLFMRPNPDNVTKVPYYGSFRLVR